jgi:uncharacterized phage protein (TIGR01671 family)
MINRAIIFRGLSIKGEWSYGNLARMPKDSYIAKAGYYISNRAGSPFAYLVRAETIGQFTGLLDKNGKEIYEGDYVNINFDCYMQVTKGIVVYKNCKFCIPEIPYELHSKTSCVVIGNVFENPELLESSNE